jgi:DNA polymerase (family X)
LRALNPRARAADKLRAMNAPNTPTPLDSAPAPAGAAAPAPPVRPLAPGVGNATVAEALRDMAMLLQVQGDNAFRVSAYRRAAHTADRLDRPLEAIYRASGPPGLDALPAVGPRISAAIAELLETGRWVALDRLRGAADPETRLRLVLRIDPLLAHRLHDELGIDTLEQLEELSRTRRFARSAGVTPAQAAALRQAIGALLHGRPEAAATDEPPVDKLLSVDLEYRSRSGRLPLITPRRFNPERLAWLPVLHTQRPGWHFTALYSNTARAHELDRVKDWVVVYADDGKHPEWTYTVVTARMGPLAGHRVVRGRDDECERIGLQPVPLSRLDRDERPRHLHVDPGQGRDAGKP